MMRKQICFFSTLSIPSILFLVACIGPARKPASDPIPDAFKRGLIQAVIEAEAVVGSSDDPNAKLNVDSCETLLSSAYQGLYNLDVDRFMPKDPVESAELEARTFEIMNRVFRLRIRLRERLRQFTEQRSEDKESLRGCVNSIRDVMRAARTIEDGLGEWYLWRKNGIKPAFAFADRTKQIKRAKVPFKSAVLDPNMPHLLVSPALTASAPPGFQSGFQLKSGDVLLSRGNAFSSAMIARIGDEDSQFSHLSILYIDSNGEKFVIEAHPDSGVLATPWEKYISDGKVRAVVYRHPDSKLAHLAGETAMKMLEDWKKTHPQQPVIPYDLAMDLSDSEKQFCSEVISIVYMKAAEQLGMGKYVVPYFLTSFKKIQGASQAQGQRNLLTAMHMTSNETFAPADIEVDPRFDLVAEWRDFSQIESARLMDAVMTKAFSWMLNDQYEIVTTGRNIFDRWTGVVFWIKNNTFIENYYKERIPGDMNDQFIKLSAIMFGVARQLGGVLEQNDEAFRRAHGGYPMSFKNMLETLETVRQEDYKRFEEYVVERKRTWLDGKWARQRLVFHHLLSPPVQWDD